MSLFASGLQGIHSAIAGMTVATYNVANVNTDGFRARRYDSTSGQLSAVGDSDRNGSATPSDLDLAAEFVSMKQHAVTLRANVRVVTVADRLQEQLLDIFG